MMGIDNTGGRALEETVADVVALPGIQSARDVSVEVAPNSCLKSMTSWPASVLDDQIAASGSAVGFTTKGAFWRMMDRPES